MKQKGSKTLTNPKKKLQPIKQRDEDVLFTGAGLQQEEEGEEEEDLDELKDQVGHLYVAEDPEIDELMNEILGEIKQDCLKMHKVASADRERRGRPGSSTKTAQRSAVRSERLQGPDSSNRQAARWYAEHL